MSNFLFATLDAGGNLPPAVGIACELVRLGHQVRFLGHPQQAAAIRASGAEFQPYRHSPQMDMAVQMPTLRQISMLVSVFTDAGIAQDVVEEARKERPDVVIVDCLLLGAIDAAAKAGLFTVVLMHSFYSFFDGPFRRTPITAALAMRGLGPRRVMSQAQRVLVCADRWLDPAGSPGRKGIGNQNGKVLWSGAVVDVDRPARGTAPGSIPRVLISLSTTAFNVQEAFMQKAVNAVAEMPVEVILTTGPAIDPAAIQAPSNVAVHNYLPDREVMPECNAVLGHGGHATTMLALAHDLPLVAAPMHPLLDQRMVGQAVQDAGAGLLIKASAPTDEIARALGIVLDSEAIRLAASAVGRRLRGADGALTGARLLAELSG
ncbi:glycosyltransferase [Arthrobacter sp. ISL-30]|uniref:glycosyltransferase n=1 Tax=Arthrobacter sp. ISL-30 TaxID=2819109 RepID=UPI001BEA74C4|nr:glycosyltransferase [Arthrobacter sp. ISL-30]MBT2512981.1 glycosyltransferase family 1 protein [Arthrobacter sp. ISL-30]